MKKHFGKFGIALVAALLMLLTCALCASAAGTATVVYLGDKGGDGLTPETATSSINTAYSLLDPDKDCTVVVCGEFAQVGNFARGHAAKSITITSVYDGVDYRKTNKAVYKVNGNRFALADDTTFENMTFETTGGSFLLVGQHHAVTIGEGVTMKNFDGSQEGKDRNGSFQNQCIHCYHGHQSSRTGAGNPSWQKSYDHRCIRQDRKHGVKEPPVH